MRKLIVSPPHHRASRLLQQPPAPLRRGNAHG